ncbi:hypothetical protein G9A89_004172 [Geosiphon pyriformis]|nr:hypothetical protein G9A89_004172 [Geosiphon pyriformis]
MNALCANTPYCLPPFLIDPVGSFVKHGEYIFGNVVKDIVLKKIVVYFKAPILSKADWENRRNELVPFSVPGMSTNALVLVDKEWFGEVYIIMTAILSKIYDNLEDERFTNITFCGHGVGGAYAAIAGLSFTIMDFIGSHPPHFKKLKKSLNISIYTYGQPRTGNIMFARMMNDLAKVTRVTRRNDYVPHFLPIENPRSIMQHHGREIWIGPIDCECPEDKEFVLFDGEAVWDCGIAKEIFNLERYSSRINHFISEKFWIPGDDMAGENKECNSGQLIAGENSIQEHYGPYFGITMGDCSGFFNR